ncbi:MAG: hypothetical protein Q8R29_03810 [bacterium]|nr:hypothetical protein [bacterium]
MIHLLFGQDTYRSRQKLKEITKEPFSQKAVSCYRLDAEDTNCATADIAQCLGASSLFSDKKMVVIENFSKLLDPQNLLLKLKSIEDSKDTTVVLWDREIVADTLSKFKNLAAKTQEFKNLTGAQLKNWISEEAKQRGLRLFPAHLERLENIGSDLWAVSNEMDKMLVEGGSYEKPDEFKGTNAFGLGDSFFTSRKQGLNDLLQLSEQGENEFNLFSYLANHCRTVLLVKYYTERKQPVPAGHKIHPFVVKKATASSRNLSFNQLVSKFKNFFEEDFKIKTGQTVPVESITKILLNG